MQRWRKSWKRMKKLYDNFSMKHTQMLVLSSGTKVEPRIRHGHATFKWKIIMDNGWEDMESQVQNAKRKRTVLRTFSGIIWSRTILLTASSKLFKGSCLIGTRFMSRTDLLTSWMRVFGNLKWKWIRQQVLVKINIMNMSTFWSSIRKYLAWEQYIPKRKKKESV